MTYTEEDTYADRVEVIKVITPCGPMTVEDRAKAKFYKRTYGYPIVIETKLVQRKRN